MDSTIVIAIVSGVVALVSVLVSSVVTIASNKRAVTAERELEQYKHTVTKELERYKLGLDVLRGDLDFGRKNIEGIIRVLGDACKQIQYIRDRVRFLIATPDENQATGEEIRAASAAFEKVYQESHFAVPPLERQILHGVKNYIGEVNSRCILHTNRERLLPTDIGEFLQPLHNAQQILIREYEKWSGYLSHEPRDFLFAPSEQRPRGMLPE